jgi:hypothetical protein
VAAGIDHGDCEVGIGLLGGLDAIGDRFAVLAELTAAGVAVQHHLGVLQLRREGPRRLLPGLLVATQRQDHVAARLPTLALQLGEHRDHDRDVELVVHRAAPEHVAVLHHRGERVARPVLPLGLDHVHVVDHHDRLLGRIGAVIAGDQDRGAEHRLDLHVVGGEAGLHQHCLQPRRIDWDLIARDHRADRDAHLQQLQRLVVQCRVGVSGRGQRDGGGAGEEGRCFQGGGSTESEGGVRRP